MSSLSCDHFALRPKAVEALGLESARDLELGVCSVGALWQCLNNPSPVQVCYNMGCMELAKTTIRKALRLLNRQFPVTSAGVFFQFLVEKSEHASYKKSRDFSLHQEAG